MLTIGSRTTFLPLHNACCWQGLCSLASSTAGRCLLSRLAVAVDQLYAPTVSLARELVGSGTCSAISAARQEVAPYVGSVTKGWGSNLSLNMTSVAKCSKFFNGYTTVKEYEGCWLGEVAPAAQLPNPVTRVTGRQRAAVNEDDQNALEECRALPVCSSRVCHKADDCSSGEFRALPAQPPL